MKYFLLFALAEYLVQPLSAQHPNHEFVVHGTAIGEKAPYAYLEFRRDGRGVVDSARISGGHFIITDFVNEPEWAHLSFHKRGAPYDAQNEADFYVEAGNLVFYGVHNNMLQAQCIGSKSQDDYALLLASLVPTNAKLDSLLAQQKFLDDFWTTSDSSVNHFLKISWKLLDEKRRELMIERESIDSAFIISHLSSFVAAHMLIDAGAESPSIQNLYDRFPQVIKNSWTGRQIKAGLDNAEFIKIGTLAPDFSAIGIDGDTVKLKNFRNKKYVLLDFWASWCGPCREITPTVRKLHDRYGSQLEVIGISDSDTNVPWRKAIAEDHMEWLHVSGTAPALRSAQNHKTLLKLYLVNTVPSLVLIDPDGRVVDKFGSGPGYKSPALLETTVTAHLSN